MYFELNEDGELLEKYKARSERLGRDIANLKIIIQAQQKPNPVSQEDLDKAYNQFFNDHPEETRETHQTPPQPQTPTKPKSDGKKSAREEPE